MPFLVWSIYTLCSKGDGMLENPNVNEADVGAKSWRETELGLAGVSLL